MVIPHLSAISVKVLVIASHLVTAETIKRDLGYNASMVPSNLKFLWFYNLVGKETYPPKLNIQVTDNG